MISNKSEGTIDVIVEIVKWFENFSIYPPEKCGSWEFTLGSAGEGYMVWMQVLTGKPAMKNLSTQFFRRPFITVCRTVCDHPAHILPDFCVLEGRQSDDGGVTASPPYSLQARNISTPLRGGYCIYRSPVIAALA